MTLKKQFQVLFNNTVVNENRVDKSMQITYDFAIGFAEWFWVNKDKFYKGERDYYLEFNELLQIYKKEKQL